jgi:hypothetical protein
MQSINECDEAMARSPRCNETRENKGEANVAEDSARSSIADLANNQLTYFQLSTI